MRSNFLTANFEAAQSEELAIEAHAAGERINTPFPESGGESFTAVIAAVDKAAGDADTAAAAAPSNLAKRVAYLYHAALARDIRYSLAGRGPLLALGMKTTLRSNYEIGQMTRILTGNA